MSFDCHGEEHARVTSVIAWRAPRNIYSGVSYSIKHVAQVRLAEGDKWQDVEYLKHTSLKTYMPYMMGGGYVLSADLAHVILGINQQVTMAVTVATDENCSKHSECLSIRI
jgi:hypothetical protein